jgi:hypothetical protein
MKHLIKIKFILLLLVLLLVVMVAVATMGMKVPSIPNKGPIVSILAEPTVNLGTTASFAILAATTITTTFTDGDSIVNGNVGLYAGSEFTNSGHVTVNGTIYLSDPAGVAQQAQTDLVTAYNDAQGRPNTSTIGVELGDNTFTPGVYVSSDALQITGTLTLDAQGDPNAVFIFKSLSTLTTAVGSNINLINGARFCRVFWVVPSSATLGVSSNFAGHIFALASITLDSGATVQGQLLARTAAVNIHHNTISNGPCETQTFAAAGGILTIYKVDSSGKPIVATTPALSAAFNIYANAADVGVNPPVQAGSIIAGTNFFRTNLQNGIYYVVEKSAPEGYGIDSTVRTVTISSGDATVTFVNGASSATTTTAEVAVVVAAETTTTTPAPVTTTVTGGKLPKTYTPWYNVLIAGFILTLIGAVIWIIRKVYEKRSKT